MNEVSIAPGELRRALAFASSVTERRNIIHVLGMVHLKIASPTSTVTGTDLDMEATASFEIAALNGEAFSFLISPRLLADIARHAEKLISISRDDDLITITADDMEVQVREVCKVDDWPNFTIPDKTGETVMAEAILHKAMRAAATSISTEETRYYLNGSLWHDAGDGKLTIVSTDGHRLTRYQTDQQWAGMPRVILPRKAHHILAGRLKDGGNRAIKVEAQGDLRMTFRDEAWELKSKMIDGTFPDYTRAIPEVSDNISFALTAAALRRFPTTGERSRAIKIDAGNGKMTHHDHEGITTTMPITGKGAAVGFNLEYLKSFANLSGTIRISGRDSGAPHRVTSEDPRLLQVLMPMRF